MSPAELSRLVEGADPVVLGLLAATAFVAATINGAVGYGFSSVTVPVGLLVTTPRLLNPALVLVEVVLNVASLAVNRRGVRPVWRETAPVLFGLLPGIAIGALLLGVIAVLPLKTLTYAGLLPLICVQLAAARAQAEARLRPIGGPASDRAAAAFGAGLGLLYATTTVSGPPLALFFSRRGLTHDGFRAALSLVRVGEAVLAATAYGLLGYFSAEGVLLAAAMLPPIVAGLPLGRWLAHHVSPAHFRRAVLGLDVVLVGIGLVTCLRNFDGRVAAAIAVAVAALAVVLVVRQQRAAAQPPAEAAT